jgi:hypothetical protein
MNQQRTSSNQSSSSSYSVRRSDERPDKRGYNERAPPREQKVSIPPMRYKLTKLTQAQTLTQIALVTQGFYNMSINSADWVQRDVRSREFSSFGSYSAPRDYNMIVAIMGEDNYYLKLTMKNHDMDYICYDSEKNEFQFWGEYQCCIKAMNELRYRIEKIKARMEKSESSNKNQVKETREQWPVSNYSPSEEEEKEEYVPASPIYMPMSLPTSFEWGMEGETRETVDASYSVVAKEQMKKMGFVDGVGLGSKGTGRIEPLSHVKDLHGRSNNRECTGLGYTNELVLSEPAVLCEPVVLSEPDVLSEPAALVPDSLVLAALVPAALVPAALVPAALVPVVLSEPVLLVVPDLSEPSPSVVPEPSVEVLSEKNKTEAELYGCKCLDNSGKCCLSCWKTWMLK